MKYSVCISVFMIAVLVQLASTVSAQTCSNICTNSDMVIGCEDRKIIPADVVSSEKGPWRFIGRFVGANNTGPKCTGALIADRFVLTAAHCFGTIKKVPLGFKLAQSSDFERPFGIHAVKRIFVPNDFGGTDNETDRAYDYAIAELFNSIDGMDVFPRWGYIPWNKLKNKQVRSAGYPSQSPTPSADGTPWSTGKAKLLESQPFKSVDDGAGGLLYTELDGSGGQSGSPVYTFINGRRKITGVLIGSPVTACENGQNWVARLTQKNVEHIRNLTDAKINTIDFFWREIELAATPDAGPDDAEWP